MINIDAVSADGHTVIGTRTDPTHPTDVFRSDLSFASLDPITNQNAWLADYALGSAEVITWKSSKDGMEIDGIVTKPVDFAAGAQVSGVAQSARRSDRRRRCSASIRASRSWRRTATCVLEPNFRGSTGRGEAFASANQNDWGGGDYQDDMSGVDAVIARGWADPARLGAFGWSYGGFMTFWIDTQTDRFKAISPGAGLPDLYSMYSETDIHRYLRRILQHEGAVGQLPGILGSFADEVRRQREDADNDSARAGGHARADSAGRGVFPRAHRAARAGGVRDVPA